MGTKEERRERLEAQLQAAWETNDLRRYELAREQLKLLELADQAAERGGLDPDRFQQWLTFISEWDDRDQVFFERGAGGLGRLAPHIARYCGLIVSEELDERNDPAKNLEALAKFLLYCVRVLGGVTLH